jgi:nitrogen fixation protein FixH
VSPLIRKDRIWPTIVVTVLSGYVAFGLIAARVATNDPHAAIEPDYYRKAVDWDSTVAQARRSAALGWRMTPMLSAIGNGSAALLSLELRDAGGAAVSDAQVSVEARQIAHAYDVVRATLGMRGDGAYAARVPVGRPGLWELRVVATRGADRYETSVRMNASATATAGVVTERPGDPLAARLKAGARREDSRATARPPVQ